MSEPNVTSRFPDARDPFSRSWWKFASRIGVFLAVTAVATVYFLFVPQYEASALVELQERPQFIAFETGARVSMADFRSQMEIIRSRRILSRTIANEKIKQMPEIRDQRDPIDWLVKQIRVVRTNGLPLFEIKYTGPNAENAALLVNEVTRQYLIAQEEGEEAMSIRDIVTALTNEMEARKNQVRTLREQVRDAMQKGSGKEPEFARHDPNTPFTNPLGVLQSRLVGIQVDRAMLTAQIKACEEELCAAEQAAKASAAEKATQTEAAVKAAAAARANRQLTPEEQDLRDEMVEREIANDPEVTRLESILSVKRGDLEQIKPGSELYVRVQKEIARCEKNLSELKTKLVPLIRKEMELSLRQAFTGREGVNVRKRSQGGKE
ncbi:MAG: hypothetical protein ABSG53_23675 [Thermoguttaceae bacterium]